MPQGLKKEVYKTQPLRKHAEVFDSHSRLYLSPEAKVFMLPCTISSFFLRRASACSLRAERFFAALAALLGVVVTQSPGRAVHFYGCPLPHSRSSFSPVLPTRLPLLLQTNSLIVRGVNDLWT